jgi:hypothetical protein
MDAEAISGAMAVAAGVARKGFTTEFVATDCKLTILPRAKRIHASVAVYAGSHFYSQIEARLYAI